MNPYDRDEVRSFLAEQLGACDQVTAFRLAHDGLDWFDTTTGSPEELWNSCQDPSFMLWLLETILPKEVLELSVEITRWSPLLTRLFAVCEELVPEIKKYFEGLGYVKDGKPEEWEDDGIVSRDDEGFWGIHLDFAGGWLHDLPVDILYFEELDTEVVRTKFLAVIRELYTYTTVAQLMMDYPQGGRE